MSNTENAAALMTAISNASNRVGEDFAHLQDLLAQALATDVADAETIARLEAEAATVGASFAEATAALNALDPDAAFPPAPVEEPVEETPPA